VLFRIVFFSVKGKRIINPPAAAQHAAAHLLLPFPSPRHTPDPSFSDRPLTVISIPAWPCFTDKRKVWAFFPCPPLFSHTNALSLLSPPFTFFIYIYLFAFFSFVDMKAVQCFVRSITECEDHRFLNLPAQQS
jgi:hypothetical protein